MARRIDLTGQKFGRLEVIEYSHTHETNKRAMWLCKCDCGNKKAVSGVNLRNGTAQSCGCIKKEQLTKFNKERLNDLTGQIFGNWEVLEYRGSDQWRNPKFYCRCKCGTEREVTGRHLVDGASKSCGCLDFSFGEEKIKELLDNLGVPYETQYQFDDSRLRFDFFIDNSYFIEFDGKQHYNTNQQWFSKEAALRDMKKNKYCLDNNIPLYRIPYGYRHSITLDLLTSDEFRVKTVDHYSLLQYIEQEEIL